MTHQTEWLVPPGATVALALAGGMIAQSLARHLRLPSIVLLLGTGVLLGPEFLGVVLPESLGSGLQVIVGFAVAVILFEGAMKLNLKRIRLQARVIRRLLTVGALVTALGGALAAHWIMGWSWHVSALFGTLVIVTGPTVITPLLRRIKVQHKVGTVLEAEGVLIDAVGAVVAVVALEVALSLSGNEIADGVFWIFGRLGFGLLCGLASGFALTGLLRVENLVPEGLQNVFTLSLVLALFHLSNTFVAESGVMSVTAAGLVVGNLQTRVQRDLMEFKEQLTALLIGMLFVLLAAGVRVHEVLSLGWPGVLTVLALMLIVRPLNVIVSAWGTDLDLRERAFISWLAPRGVVAAAIASLFSQTIAERMAAGDPEGHWTGGDQLQALVFLVIAGTVLAQGLSGGLVARALGVQRPSNRGYAILGANELGHALGRLLRDSGEEVMFLDSNPGACHTVEQDGFKVVFGNVLLERTLFRARVEDRAACIAVTPNEEANLLFAHHATREFKVPAVYVGLTTHASSHEQMVHKMGGLVLFASPRDLELWALRLRRRVATLEMWQYDGVGPSSAADPEHLHRLPDAQLLPLVTWRGRRVFPVTRTEGLRLGDIVHFAVLDDARGEAHGWLTRHGWRALYGEPASSRREADAERETVGV